MRYVIKQTHYQHMETARGEEPDKAHWRRQASRTIRADRCILRLRSGRAAYINSFVKYVFYIYLSLCTLLTQLSLSIGPGDILAPAKSVISSPIWQNIGMSFGACPGGYRYNMITYNDSNKPINAKLQSVINVQGVNFTSKTKASATIEPYKSASFSENVCHAIIMLEEQQKSGYLLHQRIDVPEHDDTLNYYHAFDVHAKPGGEFMGPGLYGGPFDTSDAFEGVFFNNSLFEDVTLNFITKDKQSYSLALEKNTFSTLSTDSTSQQAVRQPDSAFTFKAQSKTVSIPVGEHGIASKFTDPKTKKDQIAPLTYTYEVTGNSPQTFAVGIQGFNMGNYNQLGMSSDPLSESTTMAGMRDITPISCAVWYQSVTQAQQENTSSGTSAQEEKPIYYSTPNSIWTLYKTKDYELYKNLAVGSATPIILLRPRPSEGMRYLYIISVNTHDQTKATQFLKNISSSKKLSQLTKIQTSPEKISAQTAIRLEPTNGILSDQQTGLTGAVLLIDSFVPYGGGTQTTRFYKIPPPMVKIDNMFLSVFASRFSLEHYDGQDNTTRRENMNKELMQKIPLWLETLSKNLSAQSITSADMYNRKQELYNLVPDLTAYLKTKGGPALFNNPSASPEQRSFTAQGISSLYLMLLGPISLAHPPLLTQPGSNIYLFGKKPDNWPASQQT